MRVTRRFVAYILVLLLSLTPAMLTNSAAAYLPSLMIFFCGILSLVQLIYTNAKVSVSVSAGERSAIRGEIREFTLSLQNSGILAVPRLQALFVSIKSDGTDRQELPVLVTLSPKEKRNFSFDITFSHIGSVEVMIQTASVYDLLGIFRFVKQVGGGFTVDVLPRQYRFDKLPVSTYLQSESSKAITSSPLSGMDYVGVREYEFGDPIKTIQWKLSAHSGHLMTKQTESYTNTGITVVMNFNVPEYDAETRLNLLDAIAESAAAIIQYAAANGMDFDMLRYSASGEKQRRNQATIRDFTDISFAKPGTRDVSTLLSQDCASVYGQTNVALCTAELTDDIISALLLLKRNRKNPMLFYLLPEKISGNVRKTLLLPLKKLQAAAMPFVVAENTEEIVSKL